MKAVISNVNPNAFDVSVQTMDVYLPHHETVTIRERNAVDEGILSRIGDFQGNLSIPKFLSAIIVGPRSYTAEEIQAWPVRSKYYLMMKERISQYGSLVTWTHTFKDGDRDLEVQLEEDIAWADGDLKDPNYKPTRTGQITAYPKDKPQIEHRTTSGKNIRMEYLTGNGEMMGLAKPMTDIDSNDRFLFRNIEIQDKNGHWHKVQRLDMLTGRDTRELRKVVEEQDPGFSLTVSVKHPKKDQYEDLSLFGLADFFFQ